MSSADRLTASRGSRGISLEFVTQLRDTQYALQCEWSMNQVETHYRRQQYAHLESGYLNCLLTQKYYFMIMFLLVRHFKDPKSPLPEWYTALLNPQPLEHAAGSFPAIDQ
jgi:hypothetical protein